MHSAVINPFPYWYTSDNKLQFTVHRSPNSTWDITGFTLHPKMGWSRSRNPAWIRRPWALVIQAPPLKIRPSRTFGTLWLSHSLDQAWPKLGGNKMLRLLKRGKKQLLSKYIDSIETPFQVLSKYTISKGQFRPFL